MKRTTLLIVLLSLACRSASTPAVVAPPVQATPLPAPSPAPSPSFEAPQPGSFPMSDALHWMRNSAEYEAATRQTYLWAAERLAAMVRDTASGGWAVILDADETVIDNSQYLKERNAIGLRFTPATWHLWTKRREAGSIPGASDFLKRVRELGGRIAIVTNRAASECADTEANFQANGLVYDVILCNPDLDNPSKQSRWEQVANGTTPAGLPPLEVVMWIGDNIHDFPGMSQDAKGHAERLSGFGRRFVVLPNPTYGSWEKTPRQ